MIRVPRKVVKMSNYALYVQFRNFGLEMTHNQSNYACIKYVCIKLCF